MARSVWLSLAMLLAGVLHAADETVVVDFEKTDAAKIIAWDVKVEKAYRGSKFPLDKGPVHPAETTLKVNSGHKEQWPGITLKAPDGSWDLAKHEYVIVKVANRGKTNVTVNCRVDNAGGDGTNNCNSAGIDIGPEKTADLKVVFNRRRQIDHPIKLFGMRGYPDEAGGVSGGTKIDPAKITQIIIFIAKPKEDYSFELGNIRAGGTFDVAGQRPLIKEADWFPFIDQFGQFKHADWPGKTHSIEELRAAAEKETKDLAAHPAPADWDEYGGWKDGPQLEATGFFRTAKHENKWWLVDPAGRLFFSNGIDCVQYWCETIIDERLNWFENYPGALPENKEFCRGVSFHVVKGHYTGKHPAAFDFVGLNLKRKYGDGWSDAFINLAHQRVKSWGLNTIANWSDARVYLKKRTPYVVAVHYGSPPLAASEGYWGQFVDVFDPGFKAALQKRMAQEKDKTAGDKWCIGYFVDNELSWGDEVSLALATLKSPAGQAAKKVFIDDLKAKYGEVAKLNAAWGTTHDSWEALLKSTAAPDKAKALADLQAFYTKFAETYFQTCRDVVKEVAPKQMYLGCRFAWVNDRAAKASVKFCDVVSYNLYVHSIADFKFPGGDDVPLIVGEFHFGALDRGVFHPGLVAVKDQAERAQCYTDYVTGALKHPQFVGVHWFQYMDEPTTGRSLDEENYQIGFIDEVDTPYAETISASRKVGAEMYATRAGKK